MSISEDKATEMAEYELRFEIGSLPHLSDPEFEEDTGYVFDILYTKPEVNENEEGVTFYETQQIGEIIVCTDGAIERTSIETINENIREINKQVKEGEIDSI